MSVGCGYVITTIYLIRHSIPEKKKYIFQRFMSELQLNKKIGLSEKRKEKAKFKLFNPEYRNVDCIYSSEYLRAYETAKELSSIINKEIIIDSKFNERLHGNGLIESNYEERQFNDEHFKLRNGESQIEVRKRMFNGVEDIIKKQLVVIINEFNDYYNKAINYYSSLQHNRSIR